MTTLATLQAELAEAILAYCKYADRMAHQADFEQTYTTQQILELNTLINDSTRIVSLHQAMKQHLDNQLPRSFGERIRYTFDMQREYDLHNNLARVLAKAKYHPDKLEMIDERAQWKEEHEASLKNLREELLANPEIVTNAEIARLNKVNAELHETIKSLRQQLLTAQQERDYWHGQHDAKDRDNKLLKAEKEKTEVLLRAAENKIANLEKKKSASPTAPSSQNSHPKMMTKPRIP